MNKLLLVLIVLIGMLSCHSKKTNMNHSSEEHEFTNDLINETSPYLLQHAHNPVNWNAWNEEALAEAKKEDKLLIVSVGYAACHWCHVMEHESFEDSTVAAIMNEHFMPIKVDREERPDVDDVYMTACNLINGSGGWPLNAIALPDGRPIWAGTYFPKDQWMGILNQFVKLKSEDYQKLVDNADQLTKGVQAVDGILKVESKNSFDKEQLAVFNKNIFNITDYELGGRLGAPKFPMPSIYEYLLEQYRITGDKEVLRTVDVTLEAMAKGGIYDQLGGGFARYSVDAQWLVPHFEKMLYDNGQLVALYARAYKATKNPLYKEVVEQTLEYTKREMTDDSNGFYSSLDADSEGEEGKFYVWDTEELKELLGGDYEIFASYYNVKDGGNFEGHNILNVNLGMKESSFMRNMKEEEFNAVIERSNKKLMEVRSKRIRPGLDDKIITSWNALMISGYVEAYKALKNPSYKQTAIDAMAFILNKQMQDDGRFNRNFKEGKSTINAFLDDYALTIIALIDLYEITFEVDYLKHADLLAQHVLAHFKNPDTDMFYYTSDLDPPLVARKTELNDNVVPGSNSSMARALNELGILLYKKEYIDQAVQMLSNMNQQLVASDRTDFSSNWAMLYNEMVHTPYEIAIVGPDAATLREEMQTHFLPDALFLGGEEEGKLKLLEGKLQEGETFIYVCQNKVCKFPVQDVASAVDLMTR